MPSDMRYVNFNVACQDDPEVILDVMQQMLAEMAALPAGPVIVRRWPKVTRGLKNLETNQTYAVVTGRVHTLKGPDDTLGKEESPEAIYGFCA